MRGRNALHAPVTFRGRLPTNGDRGEPPAVARRAVRMRAGIIRFDACSRASFRRGRFPPSKERKI